jgi:hypothetical protein
MSAPTNPPRSPQWGPEQCTAITQSGRQCQNVAVDRGARHPDEPKLCRSHWTMRQRGQAFTLAAPDLPDRDA